VTAGRPYLVNEGTPRSEIFVPKQSGAIVPAGSAGSAGGLGSDGGGVTWTGDLVVMGSVQTERGLALAIREGIRRLDREQR